MREQDTDLIEPKLDRMRVLLVNAAASDRALIVSCPVGFEKRMSVPGGSGIRLHGSMPTVRAPPVLVPESPPAVPSGSAM